MFVLKESKLTEAFQAGMATKLITKIGRVLSRRIKKEISFSPVGIQYQNTYGKFIGFFGSVSGIDRLIRLNFKLTDSDEISSLDIYDRPRSKPTATVELEGYNIIQIVEIITQELKGEVEETIEESLEERGPTTGVGSYEDRQKMVAMFVKDTPDAMSFLMNFPLQKVYSTTYLKWSGDSDRALMPLNVFVQIVKEILFEKGLTNVTFRKRKKGSAERVVKDQALSDKFEDEVANADWREKFELLEFYVEQVADNKIQSLVCWGSPGSGKSKTVYDTLNKMGIAYKLFKGGVKNSDELFNILTKYNDGEVLVFDDFDSAMKGDSVNLLKSALENKPSREITWRDKVLTFSSGIIFISNYSKFDPAILSRSVSVEITLDNEKMLDKIESTLENFMPEVDLGIKHEILDFLKEISGGIRSIDFRQFQICVVLRLGKPMKWRKWALMQLKAQDNF